MKIYEGFWGVATTLEDTKVLQFNQNQKLDKTPSVICVDIKNLILKMVGSKNSPELSFEKKLGNHTHAHDMMMA